MRDINSWNEPASALAWRIGCVANCSSPFTRGDRPRNGDVTVHVMSAITLLWCDGFTTRARYGRHEQKE